MKIEALLKKIQDTKTLYTGQWHLSPLQSKQLGTSQFSQLPSAALWYFPESHWQYEISSLSKVILVLGKARSHRAPNLGCRGCWITWVTIVLPKKSSAGDVMHEVAHCCDEAVNHELPTAVAFWTIRIISTEECSSLKQNLMQIRCSSHSVILNAMATQYTCSQQHLVPTPID